MSISIGTTGSTILLIAFLSIQVAAQPAEPWRFLLPEAKCTEIRSPAELCRASIPSLPRPATVTNADNDLPICHISLSEAINASLANLDVVRVLAGVTAVSSGRSVYDVAIAHTGIDGQRAVFDPTFRSNQRWNRSENPTAIFDPLIPGQSLVSGNRVDGFGFDTGLSKRTVTGGVIDFGVNSNDNRFRPGTFPLNPQTGSSVELSYTQPLLQGGGVTVNRIPIVLARIDTERSYFQYKESIQSHVLGIIEAYWSLVFARTDLWARQQQVTQLEFAFKRTEAQFDAKIADVGELAQTRVAYENFRANLVAAQANVLQREAALRNIMGLPPYEPTKMVPVSSLIDDKLEIDWESAVSLAETHRPDIIELKLVLEADQQRLILSQNQAMPRLDGVALYRWNGLDGEMPNGLPISSAPGQFTDWNMGVNFSVPLGLRRDRALLRQQELIIGRDQINLQQGLHQAVHILALNLRNLEQYFEQYRRFQDVRAAAKTNLDAQMAKYNEGLIQFIVVLQAIVDWGNSVSSEALSLVQYNTELARLEFETGTILETHGIAFYEERYGSIGPLGRLAELHCYPHRIIPSGAVTRYDATGKPSEESFDLQDPLRAKRGAEDQSAPNENTPNDSSEIQVPNTSLPEPVSTSVPVRAARSLINFFRAR